MRVAARWPGSRYPSSFFRFPDSSFAPLENVPPMVATTRRKAFASVLAPPLQNRLR
jgi:hypothetical protein